MLHNLFSLLIGFCLGGILTTLYWRRKFEILAGQITALVRKSRQTEAYLEYVKATARREVYGAAYPLRSDDDAAS